MEQIYNRDLNLLLKLSENKILDVAQINNLPLIIIDDEEHIHLKALRTKVNNKVLITDGLGMTVECLILSFDKKSHTLKVLKIYYFLNEINKEIILFLGILDNKDRLEFAIEKSIELGVKKIYLMKTDYSANYSAKIKLNINRLNSKVIATVKQCKRSILPEINLIEFDGINEVLNFENQLIENQLIENQLIENQLIENQLTENYHNNNKIDKSLILLADINGEYIKKNIIDFQQNLNNSKKIFIFVGPEGGFSDKEVIHLQKYENTLLLKLSENRLRAETACISMVNNVVNFI